MILEEVQGMKRTIALSQMRPGERGIVRELLGGHGLRQRLAAMGVRPGCEIAKTSGPFMRGPVTVRVGNAQIALGFGMASKVLVEVGGKVEK
jgi:ferrous iron transport protein A